MKEEKLTGFQKGGFSNCPTGKEGTEVSLEELNKRTRQPEEMFNALSLRIDLLAYKLYEEIARLTKMQLSIIPASIIIFAFLSGGFLFCSGYSLLIGNYNTGIASLGPALASLVGLIGFYRRWRRFVMKHATPS